MTPIASASMWSRRSPPYERLETTPRWSSRASGYASPRRDPPTEAGQLPESPSGGFETGARAPPQPPDHRPLIERSTNHQDPGSTGSRPATGCADVEVVDRQERTDHRNTDVETRLRCLHEAAVRLPVVPVVRAGVPPLDLEVAADIRAERLVLLDVAVRPVDPAAPVGEVHVRRDERAPRLEQVGDLRQLLRLEPSDVLEEPLCHDDVEL